MNEQHHEMVLEMTHPSGMQGWYCPTCGRRILLRVSPNIEMVVVEPGDQYVNHSGSTGGARIGHIRLAQREEEFDELSEEVSEERLRPWIKAIESLDLDW